MINARIPFNANWDSIDFNQFLDDNKSRNDAMLTSQKALLQQIPWQHHLLQL